MAAWVASHAAAPSSPEGGTEGSNPPPSSGESVSGGTLSSWARTSAFRAGFWAAFPERSAESRRARQQRANPGQYLCRAIFQYAVSGGAVATSHWVKVARLVPNEIGLPLELGMPADLASSDRTQAKP